MWWRLCLSPEQIDFLYYLSTIYAIAELWLIMGDLGQKQTCCKLIAYDISCFFYYLGKVIDIFPQSDGEG